MARTHHSLCLAAAVLFAACSPTDTGVPESATVSEETNTAAPEVAVAGTAPADPSFLPEGVYTLDPSHASITFEVSHLGFSNYTGQFNKLDATLEIDPTNPSGGSLIATIDPTSLDIPSPPDGFLEELLGQDWLAAGQYPEIRYESSSIETTGRDRATVTGSLIMHGQSAPVILDVKFNGGWEGIPPDPFARAGFSATGTLKRSDFGLSTGLPEPGSTMGVGDEVTFRIETEFSGPPWDGADTADGDASPQ